MGTSFMSRSGVNEMCTETSSDAPADTEAGDLWLGLYCDSSYRSVMFWLKMKESQDPWLEQLSKFSKILLQKGYN